MAVKSQNNVIIILYFTSLFLPWVDATLGILYARNNTNSSERICMSYNPLFSILPESLEQTTFFQLNNLISEDGCNFTGSPSLSDKVVMVKQGGCRISQKALNVQDENGKGLIIVYASQGTPTANKSDYLSINITVAIILAADVSKITNMGSYVEVGFYALPSSNQRINYSMIGIWLISMFVIIIGSYWSGIFKHQLYVAWNQNYSTTTAATGESMASSQSRPVSIAESISLNVGVKFAVFFVFMMCGMLLLLYFFFNFLVYAIIGMFCLCSTISMILCLSTLVTISPAVNKLFRVPITWPKSFYLDFKLVFIVMVSVSLGTCWVIYRKTSFSWILQDTLGVTFCIHSLKMIRLPNFKVCVILLGLLLIYDIFFVFITPLITKSGESIMIEVATGGSSGSTEQLPVVLRIPHYPKKDHFVCHSDYDYSLLGFGDLLIPGFLISFCHGFDLKVKNRRRTYFVSTVIAYGVGLLITFVALAVMQSGQPALLYLVPCIILTVTLIGWKRGDLKHLWNGEIIYVRTFSSEEMG